MFQLLNFLLICPLIGALVIAFIHHGMYALLRHMLFLLVLQTLLHL